LERNEEYWGEKAKLKNLIIQIIPENSVRASSMMAKAIDGMNGLDSGDVESVRASGANIFEADGMNINYMAFNVTRAPFDNKALREAAVRAVNVEELVPALYSGYSETAYSILPKFIPGYAPDVKPYAYDPEKSKEILAAEGAENLEINIITYSNPRPYNSATGTRLAEAVQEYLSKVGVTAHITQYDWTTYKERVSQGEGDICFYGWTGDNGDPDNFLNLLDDNNAAMNVSGYHNPEYHELILQAAATPNGPERDKLYQQMEAIVADDAVWLPFSHAKSMAAYAVGVEGFFYHPTGSIFFQNVSKN
jgi:peptide/nickel transport system substrate-binding protein